MTLLIAMGVSVQAQAPGMLGRSLDRLAVEMADLFPKLEGDVIKVEASQVFITLGATDRIREGMELSLFRKGEEFKHPLTGVVLGRFEDDLGVLIIRNVSESYASGTVRPAKPNVTLRPGDKVRITKGKIAVALLPLTGELPAWVSRDEILDRGGQRAGLSRREGFAAPTSHVGRDTEPHGTRPARHLWRRTEWPSGWG
jgi:hypothetical protein